MQDLARISFGMSPDPGQHPAQPEFSPTDITLTRLTAAMSPARWNLGKRANLCVGLSAYNGLFAAGPAKRSFKADPEAFEPQQGFLDLFIGPGDQDAAKFWKIRRSR